jgi:ferric-dicitrate binding protein FerR (iron transport regulator)
MRENPKTRAEDLLASEGITKDQLEEKIKQEESDNSEIQIARKLYSFLISSQEPLTHSEKEELKIRIRNSIRKFIWRRYLKRGIAVAAISLGVVWVANVYFHQSASSDISIYANRIDVGNPTKDVRLILQNGEEVRIENDNSQIKYENGGENIIIDQNKEISQQTDQKQVVYNTVIVPFGKRTELSLADGSKVWLNAGSKLVYPAVFDQKKREVFIEGEAVFEISHNSSWPFIVSTKNYDVKVLGTIFNVSAYADDKYSSTVLAEGKVELIHSGTSLFSKEKLIITPGTKALFDQDKKVFSEQKVNPEDYLSWKNGYLIFESEKLEDILRKLGRYYNVDFKIADGRLGAETFSGRLDLKQSPAEVLDVISQTTPFEYVFDNNKILINKTGEPM